MTDRSVHRQSDLERRYGRLLACYPSDFRREHEQELLGVLLDAARPGQQRPGLADAADLARSALAVRLRPRPGRPRAVAAAARLMRFGGAANLIAWLVVLFSAGTVRLAGTGSSSWPLLQAHIIAIVALGPVFAGLWLILAWANSRGQHWARPAFAVLFAVNTVSLLGWLTEGATRYASADLLSCLVLWLIGLAALVLISLRRSAPYYEQEAAG
jgi:hypothetical protein